jgi:hypothetical protein
MEYLSSGFSYVTGLFYKKAVPVETEKKKRVKTDVLYAFECSNCNCCDSGKKKGYKTFKVGKTVDLEQRTRAYRTIFPQGSTFHTVTCLDMHRSERILHEILKMKGFHVKQEIFCLPPDVLKDCMDLVSLLEKAMQNEKTNLKKLSGMIGSFK